MENNGLNENRFYQSKLSEFEMEKQIISQQKYKNQPDQMEEQQSNFSDDGQLLENNRISKSQTQKNTHRLKMFIAFLSGATIVGVYYCFDQPVPIHDNVRDRFKEKLNVDDDQFEVYYNILYGCFSWPNIVLPFFSGFVADKIGSRKVLLFLTSCALLGSAIFYIGYQQIIFGLMITGRATIGICLGSIFSILSYFISFYFFGGYLSVIMSVLLGLANFFDSLNVSITPTIIDYASGSVAIWIAIITCSFSFISSILLASLDYFIEQDIKKNKQGDFKEIENQETKKGTSLTQLFTNIKQLPGLYWLIFSYTVLSLWSILPFFGNSTTIFSENQYNGDSDSNQKSSLAASMLWYLVLPLGPTIGYLLDKFGHRSKASIIAGLLTGSANLLVFNLDPYIPIIMMSLSFSTFMSSYWSQVSYIVKKEITASAYGLVMTGKFGGLAALTAIFGYMRSHLGTYWYSQIILSIFGFTTSILAFAIYLVDKKVNFGKLEKPKVNEDNQKQNEDEQQ
ncbi:hypothetical protein ABPG72_010460 [Tetrahymena utriculariae]